MKKVFKLQVLAFFTALVTIFIGCKKDAEIPPVEITTPEVPTLVTIAVSMITTTSATTGGYITTNGGTEVTVCGVCWSTSHNPTIYDNKSINVSRYNTFSSNIESLTPNTTY